MADRRVSGSDLPSPRQCRLQREPKGQHALTTPGYFETMGIGFVEGRDFRESDDDESPHVIISEGSGQILVARREPSGEGALRPRLPV